MKNIISLFLFLISSNSFSQSGWVSYGGTIPYNLNDVKFVNSATGFIVGNNGKFFYTTNSGINWTNSPTPITAELFTAYFIVGEKGWVGGANGALLKTNSMGQEWRAQNSGITEDITSIYFSDSLYGWFSGKNAKIFKTTNSGLNWIPLNPPQPLLWIKKVYFVNFLTGWCIQDKDLYKTTNGGLNWTSLLTVNSFRINDFQFRNETTGWVLWYSDGISITSNGGLNWNGFNTGKGIRNSLCFPNQQYGYIVGTPDILSSSNSGTGWSSQIYANELNSIYFVNAATGWTVGNAGKILKTTTGGVVTGFTQTSSEIPDNFSLSQNYPNPFNPSTIINYQLTINSDVSLKVYDNLGNEIETLVNEKQNAGSYSVDFNAASLPSGIYFYKLVTESFSETKKMILIK